MDPKSTATVGSAAVVAVEDDPALAVAVGVTEGGRVDRGVQGRSVLQDQRNGNELPQGALVTDSCSEERTADMSHGQHAASQIPKGRMSCTPQQAVHEADVQTAQWHECQQQLRLNMGVHYSLIPWNQIVDEIKNYSHPLPIREGDRCRNPKCDRYANENVEEFWGY